MKKTLSLVTLLMLCSACSDGVSLYTSKERNHHYRTFAQVTDAEDTGKVYFDVKKRHRQIMAETLLYKEGKTSLAFESGKCRQKKWASGVVMRYNF